MSGLARRASCRARGGSGRAGEGTRVIIMPHRHVLAITPGHRCKPTLGTRHALGHGGGAASHDRGCGRGDTALRHAGARLAASHHPPAGPGGIELLDQARLFLWLGATGRDPSVFAEPERFDLRRANADQHLAFGKGLHYCLGGNLGKLEARLAVEELARRFRRLQLSPGQQFTFHPDISFRGPQEMRVRTG